MASDIRDDVRRAAEAAAAAERQANSRALVEGRAAVMAANERAERAEERERITAWHLQQERLRFAQAEAAANAKIAGAIMAARGQSHTDRFGGQRGGGGGGGVGDGTDAASLDKLAAVKADMLAADLQQSLAAAERAVGEEREARLAAEAEAARAYQLLAEWETATAEARAEAAALRDRLEAAEADQAEAMRAVSDLHAALAAAELGRDEACTVLADLMDQLAADAAEESARERLSVARLRGVALSLDAERKALAGLIGAEES